MLVKCPKCGFDQPKDTYCANCGIEMDTYRPTKPPFWKTVVKSPLFSLFLFLALGAGAVFYMKNPNSPAPVKSKGGYAKDLTRPQTSGPTAVPLSTSTPLGSPDTNSKTETPVNTIEPSPTGTTPTPSSTANMPPTSNTQGNNLAATKTLAVEQNVPEEFIETPEKNVPIESIKGPLELEIRFVEAPLDQLRRFQSEANSDAGGDSGEMTYAIVKNSSKWLNQRAFTELDRFTKKVPALKKKLQWFSGTQEPSTGAPFGLNFQVSIQERMGGHLAGDLFISRSLVEQSADGPMTHRKDFMTHFETDVGSLIGIYGVIPHIAIKTEDKDWLQDSLLKVFLSPSFQQHESELLILFQFKSDSK